MSRRHKPDYVLIVIALLLAVIGLIVVYSISPGLASVKHVDQNYFVTKQIIAIGLGLIAFGLCSWLPIEALKKLRSVMVILCGVGVIAVQVFGEEVNGASRWIQVGGLSFQIAEMVKFTLILWLGVFLMERMQNNETDSNEKTLRPLFIIMLLVGVFIAKLESDLGSSAVIIAILATMAFTAGLPWKRLLMIGGIVAIGTILAISTSSYRRDRVATFLNPTQDCQTTGYQSCQALIAVGSGGIFGLGLGKSVQAYGYLPEAANDSIFAIIAEKFGFVGVSLVIGLYMVLFARLRRIIEHTADPFSKLFVIGVLAWISTQTIINIGAMIGLLPLKGITLPFVSYGGTSIVFVMAALGAVFQISRYMNYEPIRYANVKNSKEERYDDRALRRRNSRPYYAASGRRA
jgi:cell division protein FtsW